MKGRLLCILVVLLLTTLAIGQYGLTSTDIRLDTGDLRDRYFGIPLVYYRMSEPQRSRLLQLTQGSGVCTPTWKQCATYPLPTSNNTALMCQYFYFSMDAWIPVDKKLARAGVEDVARYIIETKAQSGLPKSMPLILKAFYTDDVSRIDAEWHEDPRIKEYRKDLDNSK